MSEPIKFGSVKEASEKGMTRPGTKDVFLIKQVEFGNTKNTNGYYMQVRFDRKDDSFQHSFFLSEKALPRVQSLIKAVTGKILETDATEPQLTAILSGKEIALKVIGKVDENSGKGYPDLGFGGFCKPAAELDFLDFTSREMDLVKAALVAIDRATSSPDSESHGTATASSGGAADERF